MSARQWGVEIPDPGQPDCRKVRECESEGHAYTVLATLSAASRPAHVVHRDETGTWRPADNPSYPTFLRYVAALLEHVPEIPRGRHGLDYSVGQPGYDDELAAATLLAAHEALTAAGVDHEYSNTDHSTAVTVTAGRRRFHVSHVYGPAWAAHEARRSYEDNVQAGSAEGGV